jgi:hypothetical protein
MSIEPTEHRKKVFLALEGFNSSHKGRKVSKDPAVGINRQSPSIVARVDATGKRLGAGNGTDKTWGGV